MAVRVLFLGRLADIAGNVEMELPAPLDWAGLLASLSPAAADQLQADRIKLAWAGRVLADKRELKAFDGDEVALLPPVSGG